MQIPRLKLKEFLDARKAIKGIDRHSTIPILESVLIRCNGESVSLGISNLETTLLRRFTITPCAPCEFCVNAKDLHEAVMSGGELVRFELRDTTVKIDGKVLLPIHDADEYPRYPMLQAGATRYTLNNDVCQTIKEFIPLTDTDDLRPVLNCVMLRSYPDRFVVCATDGHVLARKTYDAVSPNHFEANLPKDAANLIGRLTKKGGNAHFRVNGVNCFVAIDEFVIISRLLDGKQPEYDAVIPDIKNCDKVVSFDTKQMLSVVKDCEKVVGKMPIKLFFNGSLNVSCEDVEQEKQFSFDMDYNKVELEKDFAIGVYGKNILKLLSISSDKTTLRCSTESRPILYVQDNLTAVCMPVMINNH